MPWVLLVAAHARPYIDFTGARRAPPLNLNRKQDMSNQLNGKGAVITGASAGIGLSTAKRFAEDGAQVFIVGRRQAELDKAAAEIGHGTIAIQGDAASTTDLDRVYAEVKAKAGRIDVLFANAGVYEFGKFGEISEAHFDKIFDLNVRGLLFTVQKALPLMPDGASVILCGSIASIKGAESFSVYTASKAAIRSLARSWIGNPPGN